MSKPKRSREPHDRLTRICDVGIDAMEGHPEYGEDVRVVILLSDEEGGGVVIHGYERDTDAVVDLLMHLRAIMRANGKDLQIHALPGHG
jgi:hypothetical protein